MSTSRAHRGRELHRAAALTTLAALTAPLTIAVLTVAGPAVAADKGAKPGTFRGGVLIQDGWWARSNEPPPETGLAQPPSVPAVAAPEGTMPVTLVNNEAERVAALEFDLKGPDDSIVTEVLLAMRESDEQGANINADLATLIACPVTEPFWVGVDNGAWATRPAFDCEGGVAPGVRSEKGVWTFDLTALAGAWTSSTRENSPAVVLVGAPSEDPSQGAPSFQVAFDGEKGIGLAAEVTKVPAGGEGDGDGSDGFGEGSTDGGDEEGFEPSGGSSSSGSGSFGSGSGSVSTGGSGDFGSSDSGDTGDTGDLGAPDSSGIDESSGSEGSPTAGGITPDSTTDNGEQALVPVNASSPWYAGLGARAVALAVVALMLAYLVMVAMGGSAQPAVGGRQRGVGKALERLRATRPPGFSRGASSGAASAPKPLPTGNLGGTTSGAGAIITLEDRT